MPFNERSLLVLHITRWFIALNDTIWSSASVVLQGRPLLASSGGPSFLVSLDPLRHTWLRNTKSLLYFGSWGSLRVKHHHDDTNGLWSYIANIAMIRGPSHINSETLFEHMKLHLSRALNTSTNLSGSTPLDCFIFTYFRVNLFTDLANISGWSVPNLPNKLKRSDHSCVS